ncbi:MAG: MTH1187 family thiamine-binding protein [Acidobacteriia bacterium]|nr:MTH1187 family thiamine-binding protein [Terriglobia bacterium]
MKASVMVSVIPIGVGISLSKYIAACERVFAEAGLNPKLHAHGTNVEGEWDEVFGAVRKCVETVHAMGAPRISTHLKVGTRTDRSESGEEMVQSVKKKLVAG